MHSTHPFGTKEGLTGLDPDCEIVGSLQGAPFNRREGIAERVILFLEIWSLSAGQALFV